LERARKLKELGVKQDNYFWWIKTYSPSTQDGTPGGYGWSIRAAKDEDDKVNENISAFTVAELGEMLPMENVYPKVIKTIEPNDTWTINFTSRHQDHADTEADARAKMLIYLIENGLPTSITT
jgi:hypothetical protein